jgi:hypothetical protein
LFVFESGVRTTGGVWKHTVLIVINGDGKQRKSEPATRVVADEAAAIATTTMDADGE